nr:hypothetical protein [Candidatus Dadabacteria bacterium]NIS10125.1 hypothetical protein [Candidatus Dadabacteria bacterium]NIV40844.1 hypothetical protein [Candidatus Dadabacteria bacterium]NIX16530.1 hypothetical protein [Candidatus Dadabacteria bacterium]NIY23051.1 hypothetical protein [Candidatus Dadabacteria bacterium]
DTTPVSNGDGDCNEAGDADGICTAGDTSITACAANADCDTFSVDTNPCGEGDMKIKAADFATFCTVNTTSNADGVCVHDGDPDGTCTAGDTSITMCMADSDCDTFSASSIDCTKLIEDIDVSACDMEIGVIAESSNLHDPSNESDTNDCNGKKCKKDGDDKGHDRGKVLCTEVM